MVDTVNGIFISEILADNAGSGAVDTDGDGATNKADEYVELQNNSSSTVSLDGFEVWSEKQGLLYSFGAGDTLASGETATVVGNYSGTPPAGFYSAGVSESTNFLPDGEGQKFDSIFLVNTNTGTNNGEYVVLSYGQPPRAPTLPTNFPGTTQMGAGEQINSNSPNGQAFARDLNGDLVEGTPTPGVPDIPCFVKGTMILTVAGEVAVQNLKPGDKIVTLDGDPQTLRAIGRFVPTRFELSPSHDHAPVVIPRGQLGNSRDLWISSAHRVLLGGPLPQLLFGEAEVLLSGRHVVPAPAKGVKEVVYYHLLFDDHQIICAEGCWVESLFLADIGRQALDKPEYWTIETGFAADQIHHDETVRPVLKRHEADLLLNAIGAAAFEDCTVAA